MVEYTGTSNLVKHIKHNACGKFFDANGSSHLRGVWGCPYCSKKVSMVEREWLNSIGIPDTIETRQVSFNDLGIPKNHKRTDKTVDGYDPATKTVYAYNGCWWHGCPKCNDPNDIGPCEDYKSGRKLKHSETYQETLDRKAILETHGYTVISMWDCELRELKKQKKVRK